MSCHLLAVLTRQHGDSTGNPPLKVRAKPSTGASYKPKRTEQFLLHHERFLNFQPKFMQAQSILTHF